MQQVVDPKEPLELHTGHVPHWLIALGLIMVT